MITRGITCNIQQLLGEVTIFSKILKIVQSCTGFLGVAGPSLISTVNVLVYASSSTNVHKSIYTGTYLRSCKGSSAFTVSLKQSDVCLAFTYLLQYTLAYTEKRLISLFDCGF